MTSELLTPVFELPEEKRELRDTVRKFLERECPQSAAQEYDEHEEYPWELWRRIAKLGWTGIPFSIEDGGSEGDELDEAIIVEELAYAMMPFAASYLVTVLTCGKTIRDLGSDEQRKRWLPMISAGEGLIAFALTEPESGSDASSLRMRATPVDDGWILNGQKMFCTGAGIAKAIVVMARTGTPDSGSRGISAFLVDAETPGITCRKLAKLGLRPYPTYEVFFDDVHVREADVLGEVDGAWRHIVRSLNRERIACAAMCTGTAQAALDYAIGYVNERHQFGVPIGSFQAVRHRLVNAYMRVDAARMLTYRAAALELAGERPTAEASMAKVWATEAAVDVARDGMQVLGGYSYMLEYPMQRYLRDSLVHTIGAGANEIQRDIIAKEMLS
jgi:alkylation response protein AidB-like acyl-CoA dehydrogenase